MPDHTGNVDDLHSYLSRAQKDNILPDAIIGSKKGHCLGLSILYLLIAEKSNADFALVRAPDHVFIRSCDKKHCINVETLKRGEIVPDQYYLQNLFISKDSIDRGLYLKPLKGPQELSASIYLGIGYIFAKENQLELAQIFYEKSIENSINFAESHSNLGGIYWQLGKSSEAKEELNKALKINPQHYASLINLGAIYHNEKKPKDALHAYNQAIASNPVATDAYRKRAKIFLDEENNQNALLDLERILIIQPKYCDVLADKIKLLKNAKKEMAKKLESSLRQLEKTKQCLYLPI